MSDFHCPFCNTPTKEGKKDESFPFMNYSVTAYAWACPKCHWTEMLSCEDPNAPKPTPRTEGYTGEFRIKIAMFVQNCEKHNFPPEAREEIHKWAKQLKSIRAEERRIRKMVGLDNHKPQTDIDLRFQQLLSKATQ